MKADSVIPVETLLELRESWQTIREFAEGIRAERIQI